MGPGIAIKAVSGQYFSVLVFGFAQVAMDIEPLIRIMRGDSVLHGFTHTYVGATFVAFAALFLGRPCCQLWLRAWNLITAPRYLRWLQASHVISRPAAITGAFVGTYSHVFLDSIMHSDMQPWSPFTTGNSLLQAIPTGWLHLLCIGLGVVGAMALLVIFVWNKFAIEI